MAARQCYLVLGIFLEILLHIETASSIGHTIQSRVGAGPRAWGQSSLTVVDLVKVQSGLLVSLWQVARTVLDE